MSKKTVVSNPREVQGKPEKCQIACYIPKNRIENEWICIQIKRTKRVLSSGSDQCHPPRLFKCG